MEPTTNEFELNKINNKKIYLRMSKFNEHVFQSDIHISMYELPQISALCPFTYRFRIVLTTGPRVHVKHIVNEQES